LLACQLNEFVNLLRANLFIGSERGC